MTDKKENLFPNVNREVELMGPDRSKTGRRNRMDAATQQKYNERIEMARDLLRNNWTFGDIKRAFREKYGLKKSQVGHIVSVAKKRNREIIDRTQDDVTAYSIGFWAQQQRECIERIYHAKEKIKKFEKEIETHQLVLNSKNAAPDNKEMALLRIREANKGLAECRRVISASERTKMSCQDRLDKITGPGNYNRRENVQVTKDGEDVFTAASVPPMTHEEQKEAILAMHEAVMKRIKKPSEN